MIRAGTKFLISVVFFAVYAATWAADQVEQRIAELAQPQGVVFEIVTADEDALKTLLPKIRGYIDVLRDRFPELDVAVVSHGSEQFGLLEQYREESPLIHKQINQLVDADVPFHVCGTHASWRGNTAEDFPSYIDVAASGPAQINDYRALGYEVIHLR